MPFGVELPENFGDAMTPESNQAQTTDQSPDLSANTDSIENNQNEGQNLTKEQVQALVELDKLEKVKWKGKELTRQDLENGFMARQDYTRKTQQLAEERKFATNFNIDARKVLKSPELIEDFKKVYPAQYVELLEDLLEGRQLQTDKPQYNPNANGREAQAPQIPRELIKRLEATESKLTNYEKQVREAEVSKAQVELDGYFDKLSTKYPFADESVVNSRAIALLERAKQEGNEDFKITEQILDRLFKEHNDGMQAKFKSHSQKVITAQKQSNGRAREMGQGGDTPMEPARSHKTVADARKALMEQYQ